MWEYILKFGITITPFANIATVVALLISIITLVLASGIKKTMIQKIEREDFINRSEAYIASLKAYRSIFYDDKEIVSEKHYRNILKTLTEILDDFKNLLPWKEKRKIKKLQKHIINCLKESEKTNAFDSYCVDSLHSISTDLEKERKLL